MKRRKKNGNLNEAPTYTGLFKTKMQIDSMIYSPREVVERPIPSLEDVELPTDEKSVTWIHIRGLNPASAITALVKRFGLSELNAKDILTTQRLMSVEEYEKNMLLLLPVTYSHENETITEQLAIISGPNYLISFQESDRPLLENLRSEIRNRPYLKFNSRKADFLLASILNEVIGYYSEAVVRLEDQLENLEDQLLDTKQLHTELIGAIQDSRREMIHLRKLLFPFKEQLTKLLRIESGLIHRQEAPYFKDIYDQLLYILQNLESCREILSSLVDLYLNNNDLKMNIVMKQLTLIATIFIPLTFLAGVWGMNFKLMPELDWRYGYLLAWLLMIGIGVFVWLYMKRKDWM
jgi:magnesium transporter